MPDAATFDTKTHCTDAVLLIRNPAAPDADDGAAVRRSRPRRFGQGR
ncbi:hypothetical protein [Streptomyces sp. ICN988]|nr:hypothetical protein [Streptomyces sp. ICN988]